MLRAAYGKGRYCHVMPFKRPVYLCLLLLISFHLQAFMPGESQVVTLSFKDAPLQKVFAEIKKQTGYSFAYSETVLATAKLVNINVTNSRVQYALAVLFQEQPFTYTIIEKIIIIKAKTEKKISREQSSSSVLDPIDIAGRVVNQEGEPVAGVTVMVKGTNIVTATNNEGEFLLKNVDAKAVIVLTAVNIERVETNVNGRKILALTVKGRTGKLDEVQVIAYGTTSQRLNPGNVTTIKAADIAKQPVNNPLLTLQGRVPGLFIEQSTGLPGSGVTVRIQGINTLASGKDPLYVIDGVPYVSQNLTSLSSILGGSGGTFVEASGSGNPMSFINPADIESIDVLKDADATAIYGSRAANGAILITTKKGKIGQTRVNVNFQQGWGKMPRRIDLLSRDQYLEMRREAFNNDGLIPSANPGATAPNRYAPDLKIWDTSRSTNWQDELLGGTASYTDAQVSFSGGNANVQYLVGAGYHRETLVFPGDFTDAKGSLHFNINSVSNNQKFRLQLSGNYMEDDNLLPGVDLTQDALRLAPVAPPLYDGSGNINWATMPSGNSFFSTWKNPLAYLQQKYVNKTNNLIGNAVVSYKLFPGLEVKSSFGYTRLQTDELLTSPLSAIEPEARPVRVREARFGNATISSWIVEPQAVYKTAVSRGNLEILLGTTFQQRNNDLRQIIAQGYNSDLVLEDVKSATSLTPGSTIDAVYKYNALFGRLNYNWKDAYILNLTARRDGSSRFGPENRFNNFYSIAGAWIFSKWKGVNRALPFLSFGKIRASYGTTGNDQIGDYKYMNAYTTTNSSSIQVPYQGASGLQVSGLANPYLEWEETRKLQFGMDLGLFHDQILITANYAHNRSSNLLQSYALPVTTGFGNIAINFPALVQNTIWEFSLNAVAVKAKNFSWNTGINLTIPRNKLIDFPNLATSSVANSLIIGLPVTITRAYQFLGVNPNSGLYEFADKDGNPTSSPSFSTDITAVVKTDPKFYGGVQNSFSYKGVELDVLFQFVKQIGENDILFGDRPGNFAVYQAGFNVNIGNQPVNVLNRWQKLGDVTKVQRYSATYALNVYTPFLRVTSSDGEFVDASYIRLKNVSLSWQLPSHWTKLINLQGCRIYAQGQNLLTITNYKGLDPETRSASRLPPLKVFTMGLRLTL
jgi:TonB-dependent starch-binding outer membrane protein SusC